MNKREAGEMLEKILINLGDSFYWEGSVDAYRQASDDVKLKEPNIEEAKAAILAWHKAEVERIIGEDEYSGGAITFDPREEYYIGRDGLRAEQRRRAGL